MRWDWTGFSMALLFCVLALISVLLDTLWISYVMLPFQILVGVLLLVRVSRRDRR